MKVVDSTYALRIVISATSYRHSCNDTGLRSTCSASGASGGLRAKRQRVCTSGSKFRGTTEGEGSHFFPKFGHFFPKTSYVHIYVIRLHTTLMQAFSSHTARASYRKKIHNIIIQTHTHNIHACCILDSYEVFASYDVIHCLHHKPFMYHTVDVT